MKKVIYLFVGILFALPLSLSAKTLTIYHTSDTHGFFYQEAGRGGFGVLSSLIRSGSKNYLLLDSGDFANGSPEAKNSKGEKSVVMFNKLRYHATTIGDHEFDFKEEGLEKILASLTMPVLAANFVFKDTQTYPDHVQPYKIYDVDGVRVAVIGLANATPTKPVTRYEFLDPLKSIERVLPEVEAQNPSLVVVIVHDSVQDDVHNVENYTLDIAHRFPGRIHLVLGGHAHKVIQNYREGKTVYVESGYALRGVSKVSVSINDETGKVEKISSSYVPLFAATFGEDPDVSFWSDNLKDPCQDIYVGKIPVPLVKKQKYGFILDSPISNWLADLMRQEVGTPIAINNNGGLRNDLAANMAITECDLLELFPFDNQLMVVEVDGKFLKEFVSSTLGLFSYSGMKIGVLKDEDGNWYVDAITVNGEPLKETKIYQVAVSDFVASGQMEARLFSQIDEGKKHEVGIFLRELLRRDLKNSQPSEHYAEIYIPRIFREIDH